MESKGVHKHQTDYSPFKFFKFNYESTRENPRNSFAMCHLTLDLYSLGKQSIDDSGNTH